MSIRLSVLDYTYYFSNWAVLLVCVVYVYSSCGVLNLVCSQPSCFVSVITVIRVRFQHQTNTSTHGGIDVGYPESSLGADARLPLQSCMGCQRLGTFRGKDFEPAAKGASRGSL